MNTRLLVTESTAIVIVTCIIVGIGLIALIAFLVSKGSKSQNMKDAYHKFSTGMSKEEVISLLGQPTTTGVREDGAEILRWNINEGAIQAVWDKDATRSAVALANQKRLFCS